MLKKVIVRSNRSGNRSNDRAERLNRTINLATNAESLDRRRRGQFLPLSVADQQVPPNGRKSLFLLGCGVIVRGNRSGFFHGFSAFWRKSLFLLGKSNRSV